MVHVGYLTQMFYGVLFGRSAAKASWCMVHVGYVTQMFYGVLFGRELRLTQPHIQAEGIRQCI